MFRYFFILFLFGCFGKNKNLTIDEIVEIGKIKSKDCADSLKKNLENSKCHQFHVIEQNKGDFLLKCAGYFENDENYWNKYTFRISHLGIKYSEEDIKIIDSHTICKDSVWRVEVYK